MQNHVKYKAKEIEYSIVYRNRKSVGISVSIKDGVRVSAPNWVGKKQIHDIVSQKAEWIFKKLEELSKSNMDTQIKELADEAELFYMGRIMYLKLVDRPDIKRTSLRTVADMIIISLPTGMEAVERDNKIKKMLMDWYRERALEILGERVEFFSKVMGVKPSNIKVKQQKTRWGSCSSRGNLNFNWKLVMFPLEILDYVVVHELAHLKIMNHSRNFWKVVEGIIPDYKLRTKRLKEYAKKLDFPV